MKLIIFGSTGSIGTQTLSVLEGLGSEIELLGLFAFRNAPLLVEQVSRWHPRYYGLMDADASSAWTNQRGVKGSRRIERMDALERIGEADVVINAVSGFAGLDITSRTLLEGRRLGLANKESIIAAGDLVDRWKGTPGAELIPIDSEHSAIFQCIEGGIGGHAAVERLLLTASGGPFRTLSPTELDNVTVAEALRHPTWSMGPKITVDSSTLVNKGLEVIEAHFLFDVPYRAIDVVIHPQSIVHSMVEFSDGAVMAQLSNPDMRLPIGLALSFPGRLRQPFGKMDLSMPLHLDFSPPDLERFPALGVAYLAGELGGGAPCWFNATNEILVEAYLEGRISWKGISRLLGISMDRYVDCRPAESADVIELDRAARSMTAGLLKKGHVV